MLVGVFSANDSRGGFLGIVAPEGSGEGVLGQRQMFILATGPPQLGVWLELGSCLSSDSLPHLSLLSVILPSGPAYSPDRLSGGEKVRMGQRPEGRGGSGTRNSIHR